MGQNTIDVTESTFAAEVEQHKGLVLVDFWATWCGPCQIIAPSLDQLAAEYAGKVRITKLDVDANQRVAAKHVDTIIGAVPKPAIASKIQHHLAA